MSIYQSPRIKLLSQWEARRIAASQKPTLYRAYRAAALHNGEAPMSPEEFFTPPTAKEIEANPDRYVIIGKALPKPSEIESWEKKHGRAYDQFTLEDYYNMYPGEKPESKRAEPQPE